MLILSIGTHNRYSYQRDTTNKPPIITSSVVTNDTRTPLTHGKRAINSRANDFAISTNSFNLLHTKHTKVIGISIISGFHPSGFHPTENVLFIYYNKNNIPSIRISLQFVAITKFLLQNKLIIHYTHPNCCNHK